ncbi:MAG: S41 family peptidase [Saprospiraceae bacterium]|nr:S41 family peptidase [Saprospiraceae bacterium]MDW8230707.1 S41 family peptidase [Saprospiraceae bacterium]
MCKKNLLILIAITSVFLLAFKRFEDNRYFEILKNLEIFANAYKEVNHSYVDELEPGKLMRVCIDAMVGSLDPFTNYISETDIEGYRYLYDGRYNAVGLEAQKMGDWVVVTELLEDSPAHKAGLKVGDAITAVSGQSAKGRSAEDVMAFLRGVQGTKVDVTVRRPGEDKELRLTIERAEIEAKNVPHSGLVAEDIGYIHLNTFTQNAGRNVADALKALKDAHPNLKGVIFDLRDNGGGLLNEAVNVANVFVPRGEFITAMRGKVPEWDRSFSTTLNPVDEKIPVAVLINKRSASASEIVSGALQDLDRAVVIGQRSYGKGLVQNTRDIGYNAKIKLTTAKYYIPSGRCIQSVRYRNGEPVDIPDAERAVFRTRNGRPVLDGGGITPDIILPADTASGFVRALLTQHIIFDYVSEWMRKHPNAVDSIETFTFKDWDDFQQFVKHRQFTYETESEKKLRELATLAASEGLALQAEIQALERKIKADRTGEMARDRARIVREIEQEIVGRVYFQRGKVRKRLKNDPEVETAIQLLRDSARYQTILRGKG